MSCHKLYLAAAGLCFIYSAAVVRFYWFVESGMDAAVAEADEEAAADGGDWAFQDLFDPVGGEEEEEGGVRHWPLSEDGVTWSEEASARLEMETGAMMGRFQHRDAEIADILETLDVTQLLQGDCSPFAPSRLAVFSNGFRACAKRHLRGTQPSRLAWVGEAIFHQLARALGIHATPVVVVAKLQTSPNWQSILYENEIYMSNNPGFNVVHWIHNNMTRARVPKFLAAQLAQSSNGKSSRSPPPFDLSRLALEEMWELQRWSEVILLDYLAAYPDRLLSRETMRNNYSSIDNLLLDDVGGNLWMVNNERSFVEGYPVVYGNKRRNTAHLTRDGAMEAEADAMIAVVCVFKKRTLSSLRWLLRTGRPFSRLLSRVVARGEKGSEAARQEVVLEAEVMEDAAATRKRLQVALDEFDQRLTERIRLVLQHVRSCKMRKAKMKK